MKVSAGVTTPPPSQPAAPSTKAPAEPLEAPRRRRTDLDLNKTTGWKVDNTHAPTAPATPASSPPPPAPRAGESSASVLSEKEAAAPSLPSRVAREQMSARPLAEHGGADDGKRWRGQRVAAAARDVVEERLGPRVEKLRQASTVVLDEAADDPNLRFILIAVLLFVIAMVLILLSMYLR